MSVWRRLLIAFAVVVVIGAAAVAWLASRLEQDTVTPLTVANAGGVTGKALIVYQPGLSRFPDDVVAAFREGLIQSGWEVATTTASAEAPATVSGYDLVVLGSPVYAGAPGNALTRYVRRVGDFEARPVVILLTAAANAGAALRMAASLVVAAGGRPVRSIAFLTLRPNDEADRYTGSYIERALQIARDAGREQKP